MENILAHAQKVAEDAEVFVVTAEETEVHFEANRLKQLQSRQQTSVALRIIKGGRLGYATTTSLDRVNEIVDDAVETARFGMTARFRLPAPSSYPEVAIVDTSVASVPTETMIGLGEEMIGPVTTHTPGIICEADISKGTISVRILNSRGGQAGYQKSFFSLGIEGNLTQDTDMLFVGEMESSCHPVTDTRPVTDAVLQQLELAKHRASVPGKSLPVVFTPNGVASAILAPLMAAFNGRTVLQGASPIGDKLGRPVFDTKLSLWDDPTVAYRPGSRPCDDEGTPSQRTPLVERGTVAHFLYDLQTAALAGTSSTGNGSRGHGGLPAPAPTAFTIAPGSTTFAEMIQDMKEGLVIEQLMGASQSNVLGGEFSGNVLLGFKVENGTIVGRVKDTMVSGNIYQMMKQIAGLSREVKWVGGFLQTPYLYFPGVAVASKT